MDYRHLQVHQQDGIVTARLARPDARNALNPRLVAELTDFARAQRTRTDIHAVILAGTIDGFSAGVDLAESAAAMGDGRASLLEQRQALLSGPDLCKAWEDIEVITIAAIEGYCVGGACALALCCDFRVAGAGATMRLPEVPLGMNMSWGSLPRLTTLIGPARAKRLTIFGEAADADTLLAWGLVDEVVETGTADGAARQWALKVSRLPPLPVRMAKEAINATANANHRASSFMDRDQFLLTLGSDDLREGVSAFLGKRRPNFKGN